MSYNTSRAKALDAFKKDNEIENISMISDEDGAIDPEFTSSGCDICDNNLGTNTYPCNGYSTKHDKVFDGFDICGPCLALEANGYDSKYEAKLDEQLWLENLGE